MEFQPGQQIGTYRIIRLLGQGGMGAVYEVEHTQLGVHYALKAFTLESGHVDDACRTGKKTECPRRQSGDS